MDRLDISLVRLLQLVSPTLPVGAFAYSQGLEWAVEAGWVSNEASMRDWLADLISESMARTDLPILLRLHAACEADQRAEFEHWARFALACRETRELRDEELTRAAAMITLIRQLGLAGVEQWQEALAASQLAPFAFASVRWQIPPEHAALGYCYGWLENQVLAAVKLIPLGQTAGQAALLELSKLIPHAVAMASDLADDQLGAAAPAMAIASSRHESQYTRLFRS